jgi:two-component system chemotaxis response regulator CheY
VFLKNSVILVVDDSSTIRDQIIKDLNALGFFNIIQAESGIKGIVKIGEAEKSGTPVNLVISDWNMPQMTGLEFLQEVRKTPHLAQLPFLMLTTNTDLDQVLRAVNAGVNGYLVKPNTVESLKAGLETVWKRNKSKF